MHTISLATIRELIADGRIVEARTLLAVGDTGLSPEEQAACSQEIDLRQTKAEALIVQAEIMEQAGKSEEAKALYESVVEVAADFPGIQEHIKRMDEALFLARAVQRRSKRIRESASDKGSNKRSWLLPALGGGLITGLAAAALILVLIKPAVPPSNPPGPTAPKTPATVTAQPAVESPPAAVLTNTSPPATAALEPASPLPPSPSPQQSEIAPAGLESQPVHGSTPADSTMPVSIPTVSRLEEEKIPRETLQPESSAASSPGDLYTVQPGDSLSLIAERQLCHEPSWQAVYQLNRDQITDPRKLQPGMQLRMNGLVSRCPARP